MCVVEPAVPNSGIPQGKRIKRQHLPKTEGGLHYLWKDLNLAMDLEVYGVKYRIGQCDAFTQVPYLLVACMNTVTEWEKFF